MLSGQVCGDEDRDEDNRGGCGHCIPSWGVCALGVGWGALCDIGRAFGFQRAGADGLVHRALTVQPAVLPSSPPTQRVVHQPDHPPLEDSLLEWRTRPYTRKYQPAYSFSVYGNPPNPSGRPRSPKTVQSAEGEHGKEKRVVRSPCQENYLADAHPSAHKSVLESANPRMDSECASGCPWSRARATARLRDGRPPE